MHSCYYKLNFKNVSFNLYLTWLCLSFLLISYFAYLFLFSSCPSIISICSFFLFSLSAYFFFSLSVCLSPSLYQFYQHDSFDYGESYPCVGGVAGSSFFHFLSLCLFFKSFGSLSLFVSVSFYVSKCLYIFFLSQLLRHPGTCEHGIV